MARVPCWPQNGPIQKMSFIQFGKEMLACKLVFAKQFGTLHCEFFILS